MKTKGPQQMLQPFSDRAHQEAPCTGLAPHSLGRHHKRQLGSHWRKHRICYGAPGVTDFRQAVPITSVTLACVTSGMNPVYSLRPAQLLSHFSSLIQLTPAMVASLLSLSYAKHSPASGPLHKKQRGGAEAWKPSGSKAGARRVPGGVRRGTRRAGQWQSALMYDKCMWRIF